ncbi:MAG: hypothetical protein JXB10_14535 [Pirellulales bacterium]|nr:hypothetical protein [Pirellulales bacterium]
MPPSREIDLPTNESPPGVSPAAGRGASASRRRRFRRGDWVEIRSEAEIDATLDAEGKLAGLPFIPEMRRFCGRRFRVYRRAERIFLDHFYYVARLKNTVLLEGARCNGSAHADCQMHCLLFWKEAWLKPAAPGEESEVGGQGSEIRDQEAGPDAPHPACYVPSSNPPAERLCCQATELVRASRRLPWWDFRQYVRDVLDGEQTVGQLLGFFFQKIFRKLMRILGRRTPPPSPVSAATIPISATHEKLDLQPGEWVEIKSLPEILATLDTRQRHRGLGFAPEMAQFCGQRFRVAYRIERVILEWSGQFRRIRDTVALEGVICDGQAYRNCPRSCYLFWREAWLRRVEDKEGMRDEG